MSSGLTVGAMLRSRLPTRTQTGAVMPSRSSERFENARWPATSDSLMMSGDPAAIGSSSRRTLVNSTGCSSDLMTKGIGPFANPIQTA